MAKSYSVTWVGRKELGQYLARIGPRVLPVLSSVLYENASEAFARSQRIVPHADGILAGSGLVKPPAPSGDGVSVVLGYGGDASGYAERQHEDLSLRHPDPTNPKSRAQGQAKYLETPVRERIPALRSDLRARLEGLMKK